MIIFHRVLIATAIAFCAVFAVWAIGASYDGGPAIYQYMAAGFGAATLALAYYLANLKRFLGR